MVVPRALVFASCILGCGRIHIDPTSSEVDGGGDIAADPSPSVCGERTAPCTVADSEADFSSTMQGHRGWFYGYWFAGNDADRTYQAQSDFIPFVFMSGSWRPPDYQSSGPTFTWAYLHWWGGHPGANPVAKLPVRRWISGVSGSAEAVVHHAKVDFGGDGTRAILVVDGVTVLSRDVAGNDGAGFTEVVPIELRQGTTVDLMLHFIGSEGVDTTESSLVIRSR